MPRATLAPMPPSSAKQHPPLTSASDNKCHVRNIVPGPGVTCDIYPPTRLACSSWRRVLKARHGKCSANEVPKAELDPWRQREAWSSLKQVKIKAIQMPVLLHVARQHTSRGNKRAQGHQEVAFG